MCRYQCVGGEGGWRKEEGPTWRPTPLKTGGQKCLGVSKMLIILNCWSSIWGEKKSSMIWFFSVILFGFPFFFRWGEREGEGLVWFSRIFHVCSCTIWRPEGRNEKRDSSNCCELKGNVKHNYDIYLLVCLFIDLFYFLHKVRMALSLLYLLLLCIGTKCTHLVYAERF